MHQWFDFNGKELKESQLPYGGIPLLIEISHSLSDIPTSLQTSIPKELHNKIIKEIERLGLFACAYRIGRPLFVYSDKHALSIFPVTLIG